MSFFRTLTLFTGLSLPLIFLPATAQGQEAEVITIQPGDGHIDGRRIPEYTHAWQSFRVQPDGARQPLAIWYDTTSVVERGGERLLRRLQWIVPAEGSATLLLNEAERETLLPRRAMAHRAGGEPFIDLQFQEARVTGARPILPHNGSLAEPVPVELSLNLPSPAYDWRWWGVLAAALPLEPGFAARFLAFSTETNVESPLIWITARVTGEDQIDGISCWVVSVEAGAPWTLWIAKSPDEPPVQRIHIAQPDGTTMVWESIREGSDR